MTKIAERRDYLKGVTKSLYTSNPNIKPEMFYIWEVKNLDKLSFYGKDENLDEINLIKKKRSNFKSKLESLSKLLYYCTKVFLKMFLI